MKRFISTILVLSSSVFLAACAQNAPAASDKTETSDKTEENNQATDSSKTTDSDKSTDRDSTADSDSQEAKDNAQADAAEAAQPAESENTGGVTETAPAAAAPAGVTVGELNTSISDIVAQAYRNLGASASGVTYQTSDTGNQVGIFTVESAGQPIQVYVTTAAAGNDPAATFEANTANDEANNMSIMNEWSANGNTVRVVRNNMANANFVEVLDTYQHTSIHIEDALPEQLDTTLQALKAAGYPVQ